MMYTTNITITHTTTTPTTNITTTPTTTTNIHLSPTNMTTITTPIIVRARGQGRVHDGPSVPHLSLPGLRSHTQLLRLQDRLRLR